MNKLEQATFAETLRPTRVKIPDPPVWKYFGGIQSPAMWWTVDCDTQDRWFVLESYDFGKTWATNCELPSRQECWDFVATWFAQFYE